MGVLVVIVAYLADDHLRECLSELGPESTTVVVDNDASAATAELVERAGARYLAMPTNVGFAAGVNAGIAAAWDGASDVLLLNPDARVNGTQVTDLATALHSPGSHLAAVGPRLLGDEGRPQQASWPMPSPAQVWVDALGLTRLWRGRRFVTGAVLLLNGAALAEIGGLDERYFLYAEEGDWQLSAQRAGWDVAVVPSISVRHVGGASSSNEGARSELFHASGRAFARKWYGDLGATVMRLGSYVARMRRRLTGLVRHA